mmetsp:Transcript_6645/g.16268  ORF Transcript_6645/g.16268 Transcript_6645/m.16268 type:complete len:230 (+) Transcript_6645:76-765(+)
MTDAFEAEAGCSKSLAAVQTAKHNLQVCLKLLSILYKRDEDAASDLVQDDEKLAAATLFQACEDGGIMPSGDRLYLAMVMLNSALLKALHVVDSFHMHCHREYPRIMTGTLKDAQFLMDGAGMTFMDSGIGGPDDEDQALQYRGGNTVEEYRRLQAECLVLLEQAQSLERQEESDNARRLQLESECSELRKKISKVQVTPNQRCSGGTPDHEPLPAKAYAASLQKSYEH